MDQESFDELFYQGWGYVQENALIPAHLEAGGQYEGNDMPDNTVANDLNLPAPAEAWSASNPTEDLYENYNYVPQPFVPVGQEYEFIDYTHQDAANNDHLQPPMPSTSFQQGFDDLDDATAASLFSIGDPVPQRLPTPGPCTPSPTHSYSGIAGGHEFNAPYNFVPQLPSAAAGVGYLERQNPTPSCSGMAVPYGPDAPVNLVPQLPSAAAGVDYPESQSSAVSIPDYHRPAEEFEVGISSGRKYQGGKAAKPSRSRPGRAYTPYPSPPISEPDLTAFLQASMSSTGFSQDAMVFSISRRATAQIDPSLIDPCRRNAKAVRCCWADCDEIIAGREEYFYHLSVHNISTAKGKGLKDAARKCEWAGCKQTLQASSIAEHVLTHLKIKLKCLHCLEEFPRKDSFRSHHKKAHPGQVQSWDEV